MPAIPLGQLANLDIQALIEKTYGAIFMGVVASAILFGVTNSQMFLYYKTYAADPLWQKIFVAFLWVMDACHLAFNIHAVYFYVIIHYLQPDFGVAWSFRLKPILDSIITVSVNTMYALRLWRLYRGGRKILVPVVVTTLLIASLGAAIAAIYYSFIIKTFGDVNHIKWSLYTGYSASTALDISIAVSFCWILYQRRTGFAPTDSITNSIMIYTLNTGLLTSIFSLLCITTYATMPNDLIYLCLEFVLIKLYVNSFMAMLNARNSLKERWHKQEEELITAHTTTKGSSKMKESTRPRSLGCVTTGTTSLRRGSSDTASKDVGRASLHSNFLDLQTSPVRSVVIEVAVQKEVSSDMV